MRTYLTIALVLAASIGAQAGGAEAHCCGKPAPGLLHVLMDQPAGILAASHIAIPPAGQLPWNHFAPGASALIPAGLSIPGPGLSFDYASSFLSPAPNPAASVRFTRGP